jgi:hypothetical protein
LSHHLTSLSARLRTPTRGSVRSLGFPGVELGMSNLPDFTVASSAAIVERRPFRGGPPVGKPAPPTTRLTVPAGSSAAPANDPGRRNEATKAIQPPTGRSGKVGL